MDFLEWLVRAKCNIIIVLIRLGCLSGMDYRSCGWQISCSNFSNINNCSNLTCSPGCFCSNGNVLEDGVCIPPGECPSKSLKNDCYFVCIASITKVTTAQQKHLFTKIIYLTMKPFANLVCITDCYKVHFRLGDILG